MGDASYKAVVAIDFGTTFSGFAFSFLNTNDGEPGIHMNKEWGNGQGMKTVKAPTSVLLTPRREFCKFGYEAADRYAALDGANERSFLYFERFKMLLHHTEGLNRNTRIEAKNGQDMLALDIFSIALKYLKDKALESINSCTTFAYVEPSDIKWVITVPAIWKQKAKQFMREAAYKAELCTEEFPNQIVIALEPEAASLYCRSLKMKDFYGERGATYVADTEARDGNQYLVLDIGGGTLDVTAHEIITKDKVKEIHYATGGSYGGMKVNDEFEKMFQEIFGEKLIRKFKTEHPADWLDMMNQFETRKRSESIEDEGLTIRLPSNCVNFYRSYADEDCSQAIARVYTQEEVKLVRSDFLHVGPTVAKKLFDPVISEIVKHLKSLLQKPQMSKIKLMFIVGGFAGSSLLKSRITKEFGRRYKILIPNEANTAVLRGAVMFGKDPSVIDARALSETYGVRCTHNFQSADSGCTPFKKVHESGKVELMCEQRFATIARANEVVKINETRKTNPFHPVYPDQKSVAFAFYTSTNPNAKHVQDYGVRRLPGRSLVVASPDTSKGTNRLVELILYFGGTEIKVTAVDVESKNAETAFIDFLATEI